MNKKREATAPVATASSSSSSSDDDSITSSLSEQSPSPPCTPPPSSNKTTTDDLDHIVPTAIVIKNIPFSIKRDALLRLLDNQDVPQPYALNYHFDNGVFRGLAFANYRTHELALSSIHEISKISLNGRQLRAEFKRILPQQAPAGEKNRINTAEQEEKEELVFEAAIDELLVGSDDQNNPTATTGSNGGNNNNGGGGGSSSSSLRGRGFSTTTKGGGGGSGWQQQQEDDVRMILAQALAQRKHTINGADFNKNIESLDLSDPIVRDLIKKIHKFKESDEKKLVISHLNGKHRRDAHIIAELFCLGHYAEGVYPVRYMHVTRNPSDTLTSSSYQNDQQQQQQQQPQGGGGGGERGEGPSASSSREGKSRRSLNLNSPSTASLSTAGTTTSNNNNNIMNAQQEQQEQQQTTTSSNEFTPTIRPIRQPRGPEPDKNFAARKDLPHQGRLTICVCQTLGIKI